MLLSLIMEIISLVQMKRSLPNRVLCGTSLVNLSGFRFTPSTKRFYVLPVRKHVIHCSNFSHALMLDILSRGSYETTYQNLLTSIELTLLFELTTED